MLELIGCIVVGVLLGWQRWLPIRIINNSGRIITLSIIILLVTMGLKIGIDRETLQQLGMYGLQALLFAVMTIGFSIAVVGVLEKICSKPIKREDFKAEGSLEITTTNPHPYRMTLIIVGAFFVGILIGYLFMPAWVNNYLPTLTDAALYFTIFAVGIDLGLNRQMWKQILQIGKYVFLAPVGIAIGSIIAGMMTGRLLGWTIWEGGAVAAGFGWYSLSGVMISELHSVPLGTIAFLSNVIREVIAILIIPLLAKTNGRIILVAPGGATTMDTTLPVIAAVGPPGMTIIAFINGVVLSSSVPILVPLLLSQ